MGTLLDHARWNIGLKYSFSLSEWQTTYQATNSPPSAPLLTKSLGNPYDFLMCS
jgi:hypothetical protein